MQQKSGPKMYLPEGWEDTPINEIIQPQTKCRSTGSTDIYSCVDWGYLIWF